MTFDPVVLAAERAATRPAFLAFPLAEYAADEGLDDAALAARLGAAPELLAHVRLCRTPPADPDGFREAVGRIADRFGLDRAALAVAVRHGQTVAALKRDPAAPADPGQVLAARDRADP